MKITGLYFNNKSMASSFQSVEAQTYVEGITLLTSMQKEYGTLLEAQKGGPF